MKAIREYLITRHCPPTLTRTEQVRIVTQSKRFLLRRGELYKRNGFKPPVKAIFSAEQQNHILKSAHEGLGHRGKYALMQTLKERFY